MLAGSNVVSVAEHVVMQILALVRNYIPAYRQVVEGNWDIGQIAQKCATVLLNLHGCPCMHACMHMQSS